MSFKEKYPLRAGIMELSDEEIIDELGRKIYSEDIYELNLKNEVLKRIFEKIIKIEKGVL